MKKIFLIVLLIIFYFLFFNSNTKIKNFDDKNLHFHLINKLSKFINFDFKLLNTKEIFSNNKKISYKQFSNDKLRYRFYLSQTKNNVFLISKDGAIFFFSKKKLFDKDIFELTRIETNLKTLIGKEYIAEYRSIIKGITIFNDEIFVSYLSNTNSCFSNAVAHAKLNFNKIIFSSLIKLNECKKIFNFSVGGNITKYKKNKLILTTADFDIPENLESYEKNDKIFLNEPSTDPQDNSSYFGKILSIDFATKKINIISKGHRNPQGLFYDSYNDLIFSTDHGPKGGDEINIDVNPTNKPIKNFGWPKSSYGVRYTEDNNFRDISCKQKHLFKAAPLCKSHKKYGYVEPVKYFTPSIGITQIIKLNDFNSNDHHELIVASMGYNREEDDMTLHSIKLNNSFQIVSHDKFYIGDRIRDVIDLKNGYILMALESSPSPSLGLVKLN